MESRERTLAAINHRQPDRPPLYVSLTPQVAQNLCDKLNSPFEEAGDAMESARISHFGLLTDMGVNIIALAPTAPPSAPTIILPDGRIKNEWGMIMRNVGMYIDVQQLLSFCTPLMIIDEVRRRIDILGKDGG